MVVLYKNDLAETPSQNVEGCHYYTIQCVHGVAPIKRWIGKEAISRTSLQVPSLIIELTRYMNSVDR